MSNNQLTEAEIDKLEKVLQAAFDNATPDDKERLGKQFDELDRFRARLLTARTQAAAAQLAGRVDALENEIERLVGAPLLADFGKLKQSINKSASVEPRPGETIADDGAGNAVTATVPPQQPPVTSLSGRTPTMSKPAGFKGPHIVVSAPDLDALARVAQSEVAVFANYGQAQLEGGAAAVIDTVFNRTAHPSAEFPDTIQEVIDQPQQFSAINATGSWRGLEAASPSFLEMVEKHVKARAAGAPSRIRGATHFLNPRTADRSAMDSWGAHLIAHTIAWYGDWGGRFIHHHGFPQGYRPPSPHAIEYKGVISYFEGEGIPLATAVQANLPSAAAVPTSVAAAAGAMLPDSWKPEVTMERIICHWTGGAHTASGIDKFHYHILIEYDGNIVRGRFSIADNVSNLMWNPRSYAAHTKGSNTRCIGVSVCCMRGAKEKPFKPGKFPMTEVQWGQMVRVVAELCRTYGIPVTPRTVLGHGEVEKTLGKPQEGKWDPMVLPWNTALSKAEVGDHLRAEVRRLL